MNKKEAKRRKEAEQIIEKFNSLFPVGSTVPWRSVGIDGVDHSDCTVTQAAYISNSGEPVCFIKERSGYVSVSPDFVKYP